MRISDWSSDVCSSDLALAALDGIDPAAPVHIHVAEQRREVADCLAWRGRRPDELLFDTVAVDSRGRPVHATHLSDAVRPGIAASGPVSGFVPTPQAHPVDGLLPAEAYLSKGATLL